MAYLIKKKISGHEYYYAADSARVNGQPRQVNLVYLGTLENIVKKVSEAKSGNAQPEPSVPADAVEKFHVEEFGALWLANLIDKKINISKIINKIIRPRGRKPALSIGDYFLFAAFNRMIDSTSKRGLPAWYENTAVKVIHPVDTAALTSDGYWHAWNNVTDEHISKISDEFFKQLTKLYPSSKECFLFDTTNFFTFMSSTTESELAMRGNNKEGRFWLRQIGLALLIDRKNRLPFFYKAYEGNRHDSKVFASILDEMLSSLREKGREDVTLVFDKGMNSEENFSIIDQHEGVHFITTYSPSYAENLTHIERTKFKLLDTRKNRELAAHGREDEQMIGYRCTGDYWGKERTVVVTYYPPTAEKQRLAFNSKLEKLRAGLLEIKSKTKSDSTKRWGKPEFILRQCDELCESLHLPKDLYDVTLPSKDKKFSFKKNMYHVGRYIDRLGVNIIITDRHEWSTDEIVQATLDRYMVEDAFRQSKDDDLVSMFPVRHWTDQKIKCHFLSCIIALTYLRVLEVMLAEAGVKMTAATAMKEMQQLHSCLLLKKDLTVQRIIEEPNKYQAEILKAFGYEIRSCTLHKIVH